MENREKAERKRREEEEKPIEDKREVVDSFCSSRV